MNEVDELAHGVLELLHPPDVNVRSVKIRIDRDKCEGHGRCYTLAPDLVEPDDIGNGQEIGDGSVAPELENSAVQAEANCPEHAVLLEEK